MATTKAPRTLHAVEAPDHWGVVDQHDPYRYGWRYVRQPRPDGSMAVEQVGLTLEDVLHPEEEDFIVQSEAHHRRNFYLHGVFSAQVAADPATVILSDVRIAWDVPGLRAHGPDIAVIFGVRERRNWSTFDVSEEEVRPTLIVELASPTTVGIDRVNKVEDYDLAGVDLYVIVDMAVLRDPMTLRLTGYTRTPAGYQPLQPDERGWLWLAPVRVWLGIADNEIVCYNEIGEPLGDYVALRAAHEAEQMARIAAEQQAEVTQVARLTAEKRATIAEQRATIAEQRATEELQARLDAESRIRELEAALKRLQGER